MVSTSNLWSAMLSILVLVSGVYVLSWAGKELLYRVAARKAGCSSPVKYWHKDPFLGLDLFFQRIKDMTSGDSLATDRIILEAYGKTVLTNSWGTKQYVTMDSSNMQTVLTLQVDKFGNAPMNHKMCEPFLGEGIMTMDGHAWKTSRQLLNPVFTRAQVSELSSFEVHVGRMMARIPRDGSTIDMQPLCKMLFLDSSTEFIFGKSANSLLPETDSTVAQRLPRLFDEALTGMFTRYMLGSFKFLAGEKKWRRKCAEVHDIIDGLVAYGYVLLKELVKTTNDRRFIRNELMNVFFPARDTAGILTSNILFMLARHPQVWNKLRSEILNIGDEKLTFELLKSLKYAHAVICAVFKHYACRLQSAEAGKLASHPVFSHTVGALPAKSQSYSNPATKFACLLPLYTQTPRSGDRMRWNFVRSVGRDLSKAGILFRLWEVDGFVRHSKMC